LLAATVCRDDEAHPGHRGLMEERLQKILARAGVSSRRAAEKLIEQEKVLVNGRPVALGTKIVIGVDRVTLDGRLLELTPPAAVSYALNKPRHVVTTLSDPQGRKTVATFISDLPARLFPVGRLDYDAEGLLLLTNDGDLAYRLTHPRFAVARTYLTRVTGTVDPTTLERLRAGIELTDGVARPTRVSIEGKVGDTTDLEIVVTEGRNHLIKRLCEAVGHEVIALCRTEYGGVRLGKLQAGQRRLLTAVEVKQLWRATE
jgi:23S rRNA pseudouridine2605 synthase